MIRSRIRLVASMIAMSVLVPAAGHAATSQSAPYLFGYSYQTCSKGPGARCAGSVLAEETSGLLKADLQIAATLAPAHGRADGFGLVVGVVRLDKAKRSVPVTVTFDVKGANASTPTPYSAAMTGSMAYLALAVGAGAVSCAPTCIQGVSKIIALSGSPPATPAVPSIPPPLPGMPPIPPQPPAVPTLPGTGPTGAMTIRFNITNGKSLVPPGLIGIGAVVFASSVLGGGRGPRPAPAVPQTSLDDVGTSRVSGEIFVTKISIG